jgi:hypothetical protein
MVNILPVSYLMMMLLVLIFKELMTVPVQIVTTNVKHVIVSKDVLFVLKTLTEVASTNVHVMMDIMMLVLLNVYPVHVNVQPVLVKLSV